MKKVIRLVLAAVVAALCFCISIAGYAAEVPISRLGSAVEAISEDEESLSATTRSRTVNNTLSVEEQQTLVIRSGHKLLLRSGAQISGTLYIEEGGYLAVNGGRLRISGSVVCNGTISVRNTEIILRNDAMLYVSEGALLRTRDTLLTRNTDSLAICLGEMKSDCRRSVQAAFAPQLVSAVKTCMDMEGAFTQPPEIYDNIEDIPLDFSAYCINSPPVGGAVQSISCLFSNGNMLQLSVHDEKIVSIGDISMRHIAQKLDKPN